MTAVTAAVRSNRAMMVGEDEEAWRVRYVAIGDSFTEGVGDEQPDGTVRGWADLVAAGLAAAGEPVQYANLAIRGRLLEPIVTGQLDAALALDPRPTLMTLNGGGNDMLRPKADVSHLTQLIERAVEHCEAAGVRLVLISGPDPSDRLPFGKTIHRRAAELTVGVAALAAAHDLTFVDMFNDLEIRQAGYWSADRLHLNAFGHQRVASRVLAALGSEVSDQANEFTAAQRRSLRAEARYYREHVLPWVQRRLRRRSSGDTRVGKHLEWTVIAPSV